jgi:N-acetylmuramoyl-L-alanine amidase
LVRKGDVIRRRALLLGASGAAFAAAAGLIYERRSRPHVTRLPDPTGPLSPLQPSFPAGFGVRRIFIDPGHGAAGNTGNVSCYCRDEQDFTLDVARSLAEQLRATSHFDIELSRAGKQPVEYRARVEAAQAFRAEIFLSLHSDIRGQTGERWRPAEGNECPVSLAAPGFSVLWSDEGEALLGHSRNALARAIARRMRQAGFWPYAGAEYGELYEADAEERGVFVDRHAPDQRIFVLRRPTMPSVLVETHHALDPREARRWDEPATRDAFASSIAAALVDVL